MAGKLADIAKHARVSEATVSRVLNGRPGISESTRAAVMTALDVIGYERPTHLRVRRARMVGLIVPELQNPVFPALAEVVAGALAQRGFNAVLCTRTGSMSEAEYVEMLLERQVSGMIFAGGQYAEADAPHEHYERLLQLRLPVVLINAAAEHLDFPRVSTDDAVAMEQAYAHLAYLGHERIGLILGPPDHMPSRRKLATFEHVSKVANPLELVERTRFSLEGGHAAALRLFDRGVTGIICASDPIALGALDVLREAGLDVPGKVAVTGYDDASREPLLTSVRQDWDLAGRTLADMMFDLLAGREVASGKLPVELIVRASTQL